MPEAGLGGLCPVEAKDARPRMVTLKKIASALGGEWEQLRG